MSNHKLLQEIDNLKEKNQEEIYLELLNKGYKIEDIKEALDSKSVTVIKSEDTQSQSKQPPLKTSHDTLSFILGLVGATILGMGIISFVASNWSSISSEVKMGILISAVLFLHGVGLFTDSILKLNKVSKAFHLAGSIAFGASVFLVAQIFNLPINWTDGFYIWLIGVALFGIHFNNFVHDYLALIILAINGAGAFTFVSYFGFYGYNLMSSSERNFREYSTLVLSFISFLVLVFWAYLHRLSNQDKSLKNIF